MGIIAKYFNIGSVSQNRNTTVYRVLSLSGITEKIIPFFNNYPIKGIKYLDYLDFLKAIDIMKEKEHLILKGLEQIQQIKNGMNSRRDLI